MFDANNYYILYIVNGNIDNYVLHMFTNYIALKKVWQLYRAKNLLATISRLKIGRDQRLKNTLVTHMQSPKSSSTNSVFSRWRVKYEIKNIKTFAIAVGVLFSFII